MGESNGRKRRLQWPLKEWKQPVLCWCSHEKRHFRLIAAANYTKLAMLEPTGLVSRALICLGAFLFLHCEIKTFPASISWGKISADKKDKMWQMSVGDIGNSSIPGTVFAETVHRTQKITVSEKIPNQIKLKPEVKVCFFLSKYRGSDILANTEYSEKWLKEKRNKVAARWFLCCWCAADFKSAQVGRS